MHTFATWAYAILGAGLLTGFIAGVWQFAKAWDVKFSEAEAAKFDRKINWTTARKQQTVVPLLGFPLGLIVVALLSFHLWVSFTWQTYTIISIAWFLSAVPRRVWQFAVSIRNERNLHRLGLTLSEQKPYQGSAWDATKRYYRNGMARKESFGTSKKQRRLFVGRLCGLNKVSWLWLWVRHLRVMLPVLTEALLSLIWPFTATIMVFHHTWEASERLDLSPWWARD